MPPKLPELGNVIAERVLFWQDDVTDKVIVRIGEPKSFDPKNPSAPFYCPFIIENFEMSIPVEFAGGMDSIDALQKALSFVGRNLRDGEISQGRKLRWGAVDNPDLGFPVWIDSTKVES